MYRSSWLSGRIPRLLFPTTVSCRTNKGRGDGVFVAAAIAVSKWDGGVEQLNAERAQERSSADRGLAGTTPQCKENAGEIQDFRDSSLRWLCLCRYSTQAAALVGVRDGRRETLG
jgi:hypothetical protein